jgi:CDP-paratose 2-epimerase
MSRESGQHSDPEGVRPHACRRPLVGVTEDFQPGDHQKVEQVLGSISHIGAAQLRTSVALADFAQPRGRKWYAWLFPRIIHVIPVIPCLDFFAAGHIKEEPGKLVDLVEYFITCHGSEFEWLELGCSTGAEDLLSMKDDVLRLVKKLGRKVAVPAFLLENMNEADLIAGIHPQPYAVVLRRETGKAATSLDLLVHEFRGRPGQSTKEIWIAETDQITASEGGMDQVAEFCQLMKAGADRVFWPKFRDADHEPDRYMENPTRAGLVRTDGTPKLLYRLLAKHGPDGATALQRMVRRHRADSQEQYALITGGAGFVGTNLANRLAGQGKKVMIFDNLSRAGVEENLQWLCTRHGERISVKIADIRDSRLLKSALENASQVYHFAAQVAVTTSLIDPVGDFAVNAGGTLQLLDSLRSLTDPPPLLFTSTNKVYGKLADLPLIAGEKAYYPADNQVRREGIGENRPLDFYSPYGCSKGTADQYVHDFSRMYGLPAVVFRMSCIYGPHQYGTEDQGWVAHFLIRALRDQPITLFGDGKQVRDILYIDDLVDALLAAMAHMDSISGRIFNIGGGPDNAISLLEFLSQIDRINGSSAPVGFGPWRPGDQTYYVSDTTAFRTCTGWRPRIGFEEGISALYQWLRQARSEHHDLPRREWAAS